MALSPAINEAGNTKPYHGAADKKLGKAIGVAEQRGAADRNDQQHALDSPRAISIQKHPYRNLGTRNDQEIDRREQPGLGGIEPKIGRQCRRNRRH